MIIERELYLAIKPVIDSKEAIVITGMRRVGKTTLLHYISENIKSKNKIFMDLENPVNTKYFEGENYEKILDNLKFSGLDTSQKGYIFLDEIQFVKNLPSVVKYISDHHDIKFFMSGSASFYLRNLFSESLSGRKYIFELFPLNFREFLKIKGSKISLEVFRGNIHGSIFSEINRYYDEYILYGGFPAVVQKESTQEKKLALEDIFSSYFQLEVTQLGDFRKINVIRDLMLLLMERIGSKLDILKLSKELGVSRETIGNYIAFLEGTYFIKLIRPFSRNRDLEIRSIPKLYICDSGISNQFAKLNDGALFENAVFSVLRNKGEVNYYQKKSGVEIDFILNKKYAYEVKFTPYEQDIKKLKNLSLELNLDGYEIVSRKYSELDHVTYGFAI